MGTSAAVMLSALFNIPINLFSWCNDPTESNPICVLTFPVKRNISHLCYARLGSMFFLTQRPLSRLGRPTGIEKPAQYCPRPGRGFIRPPICPMSPSICSPY